MSASWSANNLTEDLARRGDSPAIWAQHGYDVNLHQVEHDLSQSRQYLLPGCASDLR